MAVIAAPPRPRLGRNTSFETSVNGANATLDGWQLAAAATTFQIEKNVASSPSASGTAHLVLDRSIGANGVMQNLTTTVGTRYQVEFDFAAAGAQAVGEVYWNGRRIHTFESSTTEWESVWLSFEGVSTPATLEFRSTPGGAVRIDDVRIYQSTNAPQVGVDRYWYFGTAFNDNITGEAFNDTVQAGAGDDTLTGNGGTDQLQGQAGNDLVFGGSGDDFLNGESGNDTLYGDSGRDSLQGGADNDVLYGGSNGDRLFGFTGNDSLYGDGGSDTLTGGTGDNTLYGGAGDDRFQAGPGADTFYGGDGTDLVTYEDSPKAVRIALWDLARNTNDASEDKYFSIEIYQGSHFNDVMLGSELGETLHGGFGGDSINGGNGNDAINGGAGNDVIVGGFGSNELRGSTGSDTFVFAFTGDGTNRVDRISDYRDGVDKLAFTAGRSFSDLTIGNEGANKVITYNTLAVTDDYGPDVPSGQVKIILVGAANATIDQADIQFNYEILF